jgi:Signal recognition particle GTPase
MLEALSDKLSGVFQKLGSHGTITEKDLDEAMREIRLALLEADVNFKVVRQFIASVRERALGADVLKSLTGPQQVIAIVNEELVNILGGSQSTLQLASKPPTVIMLVGLKGSGKTTTAAKLALHLRKGGARPILIAADPYRMAAGEQLKQLGKQLGMPVFEGEEGQKLPDLCAASLKEAQRQGATVVIVDTAGRATIDADLMTEITQMRAALNPNEVILVLDAMTGQEAVNVAQEFHNQLTVTGIIASKMDGDARGGAVLSIRAVTGLPVKFIGTAPARREGRRAGAVLPGPIRFAHPRHGRPREPDREGQRLDQRPGRQGDREEDEVEEPRSRGLHDPVPAHQADGSDEPAGRHAARHGADQAPDEGRQLRRKLLGQG